MQPEAGTFTIVLCDVVRSTGGEDDLAARRVHEHLARLIARHGGRTVPSTAGIMAVFSAAAAAIVCATELHREASGEDASRIRVGVDSGDVAFDAGGAQGEAVRTAELLTAKALAGQTLVTEVCLRLAGPIEGIEFVPGGRFRLKGAPDRIAVFEAVRQGARPGVLPLLDRTPFVGRAHELSGLRRFLDAMHAGAGATVLIAGDPGVGKSRLVEQVSDEARVRGATTVAGRCYDGPGVGPMVPIVEIIETLVRTSDPDEAHEIVGADASLLGALTPLIRARYPTDAADGLIPPAEQRRAIFRAVCDAIERAARIRPLVLVLEDLHWGDEETISLLPRIAERLATARGLVLATYRVQEAQAIASVRDEMLQHRLAHHIVVRPFGSDEVRSMLQAMSGRAPDETLVRALEHETGGIPFFIEETVRFLAEEHRLFEGDGRLAATVHREPGRLPDSARLVIERRLVRLGPATMRLLRAAAVAGRPLTLSFLRSIGEVEGDALLDAVDEAERAGVLVSAGEGHEMTFAFAHELSRQTVLAGLTGARRQQMHAWVADAIEREASDPDSAAAEIAGHLVAAGGAAPTDKTIAYLMIAGEQALVAAAFAEAQRRFEIAVSLSRAGSPERARAEFALGRAIAAGGDASGSIVVLERALETATALDDPALMGSVARMLVGSMGRDDRWADAMDVARRVVDAHGERTTPGGAWLTGWIGFQLSEDGDPEAGEPYMAKAVRDATPFGEAARAACLAYQFAHLAMWCKLDEAAERGAETVRLLERHGDLHQRLGARLALSWTFGLLGRLSDVDRVAQTQDREGRLISHTQTVLNAAYERALVRVAADGRVDAFDATIEAVREHAFTGSRMHRAHWLNHKGSALHWSGRWEDAARLHEEAIEHDPPSAWSGQSLGLSARAAALTGDREGAIRALDRARPLLPTPGKPATVGSRLLLSLVVETLLALGEREQAAELHPLMEETVETGMILRVFYDFRLLRLVAGRAAAAAGRYDVAETHFSIAARQAEELPMRLERPAVLLAHGTMLLDAGRDHARAVAMLEEALDAYRRLGMSRHADEAATTLADARNRSGTAPATPSSGTETFTLRREGHFWSVGSGSREARAKDSRGLGYIAVLVAAPHREIHALDLVASSAQAGATAADRATRDALRGTDAGELLDDAAKRAYRQRLETLAADLEEAEAFNDAGRAERAREEIEAITAQLVSATGLGGRGRRTGSAAERARVAVRNSIATALRTIQALDEPLALHLRNALKTGTYCSYTPDRPVSWTL